MRSSSLRGAQGDAAIQQLDCFATLAMTEMADA